MHELLRNQGVRPETIVTNDLRGLVNFPERRETASPRSISIRSKALVTMRTTREGTPLWISDTASGPLARVKLHTTAESGYQEIWLQALIHEHPRRAAPFPHRAELRTDNGGLPRAVRRRMI